MSDIPAEFISAVCAHTGVPAEFLTGDTAAALWDSAQRAWDWRTATAAPAAPPTSAVSAATPPPTQIPTQQLVPGEDWLAAWRAGRLTLAGAPQPPPRRNNGHNRRNGPS